MYDLFLRQTRKEQILQKNQRYLVGVSGGPDSLFLLLCLLKLQPMWNWTLAIAHVNHGLRGEIADEEAEFVQHLAKKYKMDFFSTKINLMQSLVAKEKGLEAAGREERYSFFERISRKWKADAVLLGHHADDQLENFFIRILRGSGPQGLKAIDSVRTFESGLTVLRPLLSFRHDEIVRFLDSEGQIYCQDESNFEGEYLRSKVRTTLLPMIKELSPGVHHHIRHIQTALQQDEDWIAESLSHCTADLPQDPFCFMSLPLNREHPWPKAFISRWLIQSFYKVVKQGEPLQYKHIETVLEHLDQIPTYWRCSLPNGLEAVISNQYLFVLHPFHEHGKEVQGETIMTAVLSSRTLDLPSFSCQLMVVPWTEKDPKIGGLASTRVMNQEFSLRTWRAGDTIEFKQGFSKKVSDYFQERHVPVPWRKRIPLLLQNQRIVLIPNHFVAEEYQNYEGEMGIRITINSYPK